MLEANILPAGRFSGLINWCQERKAERDITFLSVSGRTGLKRTGFAAPCWKVCRDFMHCHAPADRTISARFGHASDLKPTTTTFGGLGVLFELGFNSTDPNRL